MRALGVTAVSAGAARHQKEPEKTPTMPKWRGWFQAMSKAERPPRDAPRMAVAVNR